MSDETRDVGVGTSPDGQIAIVIDDKGHIIDPEDAEWIAERIGTICGTEPLPAPERRIEEMSTLARGIGDTVLSNLHESDIETASDVRDVGFTGLVDIDGLGETSASELLKMSYGEDGR